MADLEDNLGAIEELDAQAIALSSDSGDDARGTVDSLDLHYTMLYGLDAKTTSRAIGCYTGRREGQEHIQPAGFVLDRSGTVVHAVYSSGKVGRLTAADAIAVLEGLDD